MLSVENLQLGQRLRGVSLTVEAGECVALMGASGSGKTSLLQVVSGLLQPDSGRVLYQGQDWAQVPAGQRGVGYVFQQAALLPHLTVYDNLAFGLKARGSSHIKAKVLAAAERLGLEGLLARPPAQLSGGQAQRVALGRVLLREAKVLLFDEPLSSLDAHLRDDLRQQLLSVQQSLGCPTIYVTHDQQEALHVGQRLGVLAGGQLLQLDRPEVVYQQPASLAVAQFWAEMRLLPAQSDQGWLYCAGKTWPIAAKAGCQHWGSHPEHWRIESHAEGETVPVQVQQVQWLGTHQRVQVVGEGLNLALRWPLDQALPAAIGVRLLGGVGFDAAGLRL
jgi:ABC-type sugar transport system ATPase subunit